MIVIESLLIVTALSIDAFLSGFSYGTNQIRIPFLSVFVISMICSLILAISLLFGAILKPWLPIELTAALCFLLLFGLGVTKIFDSTVKAFIRRHAAFEKKIHFSVSHFGFILNIYADPEVADRDHSRVLSTSEASCLALALSLDSLAVGFSAGLSQANPILLITFSLLFNILAITLGFLIGNHLSKNSQLDLSWLGGAILILIAILKLP